MRRFILLNSKKYPEDFSNVRINLAAEINKQEFIENKIVERVNKYNPKLNIENIEYMPMPNIQARFPKIQDSVHAGGIIEERSINVSEIEYYEERGWFCESRDDSYFAYYLLMYVFISHPIEEWRDSFISQTFFPAFSGYMNNMLSSSSITIADKPILYINIVFDKITALDILRPLVFLIGSGQLEYCEVFSTPITPDILPTEMKEYIRRYSIDFTSLYNASDDKYSDDYVSIDFARKELTIKSEKINEITRIENNKVKIIGSEGSSEKFYLKEIIPAVYLAKKFDYSINISQYSLYIDNYTHSNYSYTQKMDRMIQLLAYLRKLI